MTLLVGCFTTLSMGLYMLVRFFLGYAPPEVYEYPQGTLVLGGLFIVWGISFLVGYLLEVTKKNNLPA